LKFLPYNNCFTSAALQFYDCRLKLTLNFLRLQVVAIAYDQNLLYKSGV
jgi:hypothetical protein